MSIIGPRPLLVKYLERYNEEQHHRHDVRPGLTGYAQAHGRNAVSWEDKFGPDILVPVVGDNLGVTCGNIFGRSYELLSELQPDGSIGHPIAAVCIRTSTERPEALEAGDFILAGITTKELLNATDMDNFFDRSSYLYEEPGNLLKQELREPAIYNAIIKTIAEGASRMNDIKRKVGEENSIVSKYLKTLIDLGIAKKEIPITEKPGKKTIYLLADNFFRFWYRFVPINMSAIDSGRIAGKIFSKSL